jgi:hypothetical protein
VTGTAAVPAWPNTSREQALALSIVEMCCVSETLTGVFLAEMAARTQEPVAERVVRGLLADELDHGRLGWAYLQELASRDMDFSFIEQALPQILDRELEDILTPAPGADDRTLEAHGYIGTRLAAEIYRAGVADVVAPGFAALGIQMPGPGRRAGQ